MRRERRLGHDWDALCGSRGIVFSIGDQAYANATLATPGRQPPHAGTSLDARGGVILLRGQALRPWSSEESRRHQKRRAKLHKLMQAAQAARRPTLREKVEALPIVLPANVDVKAILSQATALWTPNWLRHHADLRIGTKSYDQHLLELSGHGAEGQAAIDALHVRVNRTIGKRWHALREANL